MNKPKNPPNHTKVLVFIGPSGAGKSSLASQLVEQGTIILTPTWTDRPRRKQEVGLEHVFTTSQEMTQKNHDGFFIDEPLTFFGLPYRYALPKVLESSEAQVPAIMMRVNVLALVAYYYPNAVIYQIEAPKQRVEAMLHERQNNGSELGTRLEQYDLEISKGRLAAYRVFVNDNLAQTLEQIEQAIKSDFT